MNQEEATELFEHLRAADRALHAAFCLLAEGEGAGRHDVYRKRLARVLSDTFLGVTRPLYEEFPALMPADVKGLAVLPAEVQQALFDGRPPT